MNGEILPVDIESVVEHVVDGSLIALPAAFSAEYSGVSMVAIRAIIRKLAKDLHLVAVPSTSLQADLLNGADPALMADILVREDDRYYGPLENVDDGANKRVGLTFAANGKEHFAKTAYIPDVSGGGGAS